MKDIILNNINISVPTKSLIINSELKIIYGLKYGLVAPNGLGKSTLLHYISTRQIPIPKNIDIFLVNQELNFDLSKSIYDIVSDANYKKIRIEEKLKENIELDRYNYLQEKLNSFSKDESIVRKILYGLGFSYDEQNQPFGTFSGGWRMRVAIARGLYIQPHLLLLDEPTCNLDLNAVIWLTNYLKSWKRSLLIVSHDVNFLNLCNKIIHIENKTLNYYNGNYDGFKKSYQLHLIEVEKQWMKIVKRKKEMQNKSTKKEIVDAYMKTNAHLEPLKIYKVKMTFNQVSEIKSPYLSLINVTFGYKHNLFENINLQINSNSKICLVASNGLGKTTLLQLMAGKITNYQGEIIKNPNVRIGYYNQHLIESLPLDKSPVEFLSHIDIAIAQKYLGSIGLEGKLHHKKISYLSGGQKARVMLAYLRAMDPHLLLLDEMTNSLDVESIEALILAINDFNGAIVMITHDIEVIEKTNFDIYQLKNKTLSKVDFDDYYDEVLETIELKS